MIKGIGVDIVEITRIKNDESFINKVLSSQEIDIYKQLKTEKRQKEFLAGRFCAKEAFLKAMGVGIGPIPLKDISITYGDNNQPIINFEKTFVSISHEKDYAIAYVIIEL